MVNVLSAANLHNQALGHALAGWVCTVSAQCARGLEKRRASYAIALVVGVGH